MGKDRLEMLRRWLRSKSIHPADIAATLKWAEEETAAGRSPNDKQVLEKAESIHANVVEQFRGIDPTPIHINSVMEHKWIWSWKVGVSALIGSLIGGLLNAIWR